MISNILVRKIEAYDVPMIIEGFQKANWLKPASLFNQYLEEQKLTKRIVWVAFYKEQFAGYITLQWQSQYKLFRDNEIPEIMDLNVLPKYRKLGIASHLLVVAEQEAAKRCEMIGIGVGLYAGSDGGYGSAQRLYVKKGYIPDGCGVTYNYEFVEPGATHNIDDDLILWFTKNLK